MDEQEKTPNPADSNYIEAIKDLKGKMEGMVSKEDYENLVKQNKQLLETVVNGASPEEGKAPEGPSDDELVKKIKDPRISNRDGWGALLELRNRKFEKTGVDPFVGEQVPGDDREITQDDKQAGQNLADIIQDCLDKSEEDHGMFNNLLVSRLTGFQPASKKR